MQLSRADGSQSSFANTFKPETPRNNPIKFGVTTYGALLSSELVDSFERVGRESAKSSAANSRQNSKSPSVFSRKSGYNTPLTSRSLSPAPQVQPQGLNLVNTTTPNAALAVFNHHAHQNSSLVANMAAHPLPVIQEPSPSASASSSASTSTSSGSTATVQASSSSSSSNPLLQPNTHTFRPRQRQTGRGNIRPASERFAEMQRDRETPPRS